MSEGPQKLVGFQCAECRHRVTFVAASVMQLYARTGETIEDVTRRLTCHKCGGAARGPVWLTDDDVKWWMCGDRENESWFKT